MGFLPHIHCHILSNLAIHIHVALCSTYIPMTLLIRITRLIFSSITMGMYDIKQDPLYYKL